MRPIFALLAAVCAVYSAATAAQSEYPNKPLRMIVGFAAGGISDALARALAVGAYPARDRAARAGGEVLRRARRLRQS